MAVAGLPVANRNHALDMVMAAREIRDYMVQRQEELGDRTFGIRLGINSGNVVAGIVGLRKFSYDIWGDTVNTAARMEQNSEPGKINISQSTYELIKDEINVKEVRENKNIEPEVLLDVEINLELKIEGKYRELVRALQEMRKKFGLTPSDVVTLTFETNGGSRENLGRHKKLLILHLRL